MSSHKKKESLYASRIERFENIQIEIFFPKKDLRYVLT
jgi:hypothetical protein